MDGRSAPSGSWLTRVRGLLMLACLLCSAGAARTPAGTPGEVEVEAAYLVNFLRYTEWPSGSLSVPGAPYLLTVVGSEQAAARVRAVAAAAGTIGGRPIEVRWLQARGSRAAPFDTTQDAEARAKLRGSHLVFFHRSAGRVLPQVLDDLSGMPVLTVSDTDDFTGQGGMLGLVRSDRRIVFQANTGAIRQSGLLVSAKVLKLARAEPRSSP